MTLDITTPSGLTTAVRDAIKGIGGALVAVGVLQDSTLTAILGLVSYLVPAGYAIYKQIKMKAVNDA